MKIFESYELVFQRGWSDAYYGLRYGHSFVKANDDSEAARSYRTGFSQGRIDGIFKDLRIAGIDCSSINWESLRMLLNAEDWQFGNSLNAPTNSEYSRVWVLMIACGIEPRNVSGKSVILFRQFLIEAMNLGDRRSARKMGANVRGSKKRVA